MDTLPVINCDGCGACCEKMGSPPFTKLEIKALPQDLREEVLKYNKVKYKREEDGLPCYWFDTETKKCQNYENRPFVCEDFNVGEIACLYWRRNAKLITDNELFEMTNILNKTEKNKNS